MKETLIGDSSAGVILRQVQYFLLQMRIFGAILKLKSCQFSYLNAGMKFALVFETPSHKFGSLTLNSKTITCRHSELEQLVLPLLRGQVFHVATQEAFGDICRCGRIDSQRQVEFFFSPARSANRYGLNRRWVSVYDLRKGSDSDIKEALIAYWLFRNFRVEQTYVFSMVVESAWPSLIPWKHASREVNGKELFVPFVEAWYPGHMPVELFNESLAVSICLPAP